MGGVVREAEAEQDFGGKKRRRRREKERDVGKKVPQPARARFVPAGEEQITFSSDLDIADGPKKRAMDP